MVKTGWTKIINSRVNPRDLIDLIIDKVQYMDVRIMVKSITKISKNKPIILDESSELSNGRR